MSVNVCVQDLGLFPGPSADNRRLEVVADGLPLFHAQLAVDTTMVSTIRADGAPGGSVQNGMEPHWRTRKGPTRGRWSEESYSFLGQLARARARSEPREMRAAARRAWFRRWCTALACCAAQAFALSLLELRGGLGSDGALPSTIDWEDCHGGQS